MLGRVLSFTVWLVVAASAVFWGLRLAAKPQGVPPRAVAAGMSVAVGGDTARVFGAEAAPSAEPEPETVAAPSRFQLVGVVAPRQPGASDVGLALIALDGKPAKAYRVGSRVDGETVLQAVHARGAQLGPLGGPAAMRLELAALPPPSTGVPGAPGSDPKPAPAVAPGWSPGMPSPQARPPGFQPQARQIPPPPPLPQGVSPGSVPPAPGVAGSVPPRYLPAGVAPYGSGAPYGGSRPAGQGVPQPYPVQQELPEGDSTPLERNQQR
jgi:general secretion pathway protein C